MNNIILHRNVVIAALVFRVVITVAKTLFLSLEFFADTFKYKLKLLPVGADPNINPPNLLCLEHAQNPVFFYLWSSSCTSNNLHLKLI